jgi:hypothetical protein
MPTNNKLFSKVFCLLLFEGTFTLAFIKKIHKEVTKELKSRFFQLFLLVDVQH